MPKDENKETVETKHEAGRKPPEATAPKEDAPKPIISDLASI